MIDGYVRNGAPPPIAGWTWGGKGGFLHERMNALPCFLDSPYTISRLQLTLI